MNFDNFTIKAQQALQQMGMDTNGAALGRGDTVAVGLPGTPPHSRSNPPVRHWAASSHQSP